MSGRLVRRQEQWSCNDEAVLSVRSVWACLWFSIQSTAKPQHNVLYPPTVHPHLKRCIGSQTAILLPTPSTLAENNILAVEDSRKFCVCQAPWVSVLLFVWLIVFQRSSSAPRVFEIFLLASAYHIFRSIFFDLSVKGSLFLKVSTIFHDATLSFLNFSPKTI